MKVKLTKQKYTVVDAVVHSWLLINTQDHRTGLNRYQIQTEPGSENYFFATT